MAAAVAFSPPTAPSTECHIPTIPAFIWILPSYLGIPIIPYYLLELVFSPPIFKDSMLWLVRVTGFCREHSMLLLVRVTSLVPLILSNPLSSP